MKKIVVSILVVAMCCMLLTGCMCKHEWQDATCLAPTTCALCNKTQGEPLGHIVGETVSGALDISAKQIQSYEKCGVCGEILSEDTVNLTTMIENGEFLFTPNQFNDGVTALYGGEFSMEIDTLDSGALISFINDSSGSAIGALMYLNSSENLTMADVDNTGVTGLLVYFYTEDNTVIIQAMQDIMLACDMSLDEQGALNALSETIDKYPDAYTKNGVSYTVSLNDGDFVFLVAVA